MVKIDMSMPISCAECPFNYDGEECVASFENCLPIFFDWARKKFQGDDASYDYCGERHPRCPLMEVPDDDE